MKCHVCGAELEMSAKELSSLGGIKSSLLLTSEEKTKRGRLGGIASGKARRKVTSVKS